MRTGDRLILAGLLVAFLAALVVLQVTGHDDATLVGLFGPAVSGLFGLLLLQRAQVNGGKVDAVAADTRAVRVATDGLMTERFDSLEGQLTTAGTDRAENARADRVDDQDARDDRATPVTGTAHATSEDPPDRPL